MIYDLNLADDAFENMEVTVAPQFTAGNRVLLEAIKEKYNPTMLIHESELTNKVNL